MLQPVLFNQPHPTTLPYSTPQTLLASGAVRPVSDDAIRSKRRLHGVLMGVSWAVLLPLGPIFARIMQLSPPDRRDFWFKLHVLCQTGGVLLSTVGFVYALASFSGGISSVPHSHGKLGTVVVVMSWGQVLSAVFRPHPGPGATRTAWAGLHWLIGRSTVLLGVVNVLIGIEILGAYNQEDRKPWFVGFSVPFAVVCVLFGDFIFRRLVQRHRNAAVDGKPAHGVPDHDGFMDLGSTEMQGSTSSTLSSVGEALPDLEGPSSMATLTLQRRGSRVGSSEL